MSQATATGVSPQLFHSYAEPASNRASRWLWLLALVLAAVGVASGIARAVFVDDHVSRVDPLRDRLLPMLGITDPRAAERPALRALIDGRFRDHAILTRLHVLAGALFLLGVPLQLSRRFRSGHPRMHRRIGRLLVAAGIASAIPGFYFGLLMPIAGAPEATVIAIFGGLFVVALLNGFAAARRQDYTRHREWMIRAASAALAISTVRLYGIPLDLVFTPSGLTTQQIFIIDLWLGWVTTVGVAELWIRTRFRFSQ